MMKMKPGQQKQMQTRTRAGQGMGGGQQQMRAMKTPVYADGGKVGGKKGKKC
jgi:hypothetical protein